jgi:hypothetical protein
MITLRTTIKRIKRRKTNRVVFLKNVHLESRVFKTLIKFEIDEETNKVKLIT